MKTNRMPRDGTATKDKILDAAQSLILDRGLAGTSIDRIIDTVGITKGTFFHHFKSKAALAETLIARYAAADLALLRDICAKADERSADPLERIFHIIDQFAETLESMNLDGPGCLFASFAYQRLEYPDQIGPVIGDWLDQTHRLLRPYYDAARTACAERPAQSSDEMIDFLLTIFEGAFVMAVMRKDPTLPGRQLRQYRQQLERILVR